MSSNAVVEARAMVEQEGDRYVAEAQGFMHELARTRTRSHELFGQIHDLADASATSSMSSSGRRWSSRA